MELSGRTKQTEYKIRYEAVESLIATDALERPDAALSNRSKNPGPKSSEACGGRDNTETRGNRLLTRRSRTRDNKKFETEW